MSISSQNNLNLSNTRVKDYKINDVKCLEKKMKFCDRLNVSGTVRDSGKQIFVELQTVVFEFFKRPPI